MGEHNSIIDKIWQMLQSNDTNTLNLTKGFEELLDMANKAVCLGPTKTREFGSKMKNEEEFLRRCRVLKLRRWKGS